MRSLQFLLFAAIAVNAIPTARNALSEISLAAREALVESIKPTVGDIYVLRDEQLFRKRSINYDNDNGTTDSLDIFALDPHSEATLHLGPYNKHVRTSINDFLPRSLFKRALPEDWDEEEAFKCGDTKVMFGDHIDSGATGAVYKAETKEGKQVAMKGGSDARLLDTEFSIVQKIGSQTNIVEMYARCEVGIQQYIMMELLTGGTLQTRVDGKIYTTSASEALTKVVMAQIFAAVQTMHDKGVAHQDLKPGNIIFGDKDVAKVIDFGEATTEKTVTTIDVAGGIRAPEAELKTTTQLDPIANDVWEVGVIMVSMLLGKKPWPDAIATNAKAIWSASSPSQRSTACKKEWPAFSSDFCDVLAKVFCTQLDRKPLSVFATAIADPNLKLFDDCNDSNKKTSKRSLQESEMLIIRVDEEEDAWVIRAIVN